MKETKTYFDLFCWFFLVNFWCMLVFCFFCVFWCLFLCFFGGGFCGVCKVMCFCFLHCAFSKNGNPRPRFLSLGLNMNTHKRLVNLMKALHCMKRLASNPKEVAAPIPPRNQPTSQPANHPTNKPTSRGTSASPPQWASQEQSPTLSPANLPPTFGKTRKNPGKPQGHHCFYLFS